MSETATIDPDVVNTVKRARSKDPEQAALLRIGALLEPLDPDARGRVIAYYGMRYAANLVAATKAPTT